MRPPREAGVDLGTPARATLMRFREGLRAARRAAAERTRSSLPARPFLLVTPLGLSMRVALNAALSAYDIVVEGRVVLADRRLALSLPYVDDLGDARLSRALAYDALWHQAFPGSAVERWTLASGDDYGRLVRLKSAIRAPLPAIAVRVRAGRLVMTAHLRAFHLPDRERLGKEVALLDTLVAA